MPIYTYTCRKCSKKFDILVGMTQEKTPIQCPDCRSFDAEKGFAPFQISGGASANASSGGSSSAGRCGSCSGGSCSSCSH